MKYAKLIDNFPAYAPNPILIDGFYISNPPGEFYTELGYKPVVYSDKPSDPPAGFYWAEHWAEDDTNIVQSWVLEQYEDIPADMAMEILFGGENE